MDRGELPYQGGSPYPSLAALRIRFSSFLHEGLIRGIGDFEELLETTFVDVDNLLA